MKKLSTNSGDCAGKERWFSGFDTAQDVARHRHCHACLVDIALLVQRQDPFVVEAAEASFADTLQELFARLGPSLKVAAAILRDERLFQAPLCVGAWN